MPDFNVRDPTHWERLGGFVDKALLQFGLDDMLAKIRSHIDGSPRDLAFNLLFAERVAAKFTALRDELRAKLPLPSETRITCAACGWVGQGIVLNEAEILSWLSMHGTPAGAPIRIRCPRCTAEHGGQIVDAERVP